MTGLSLPTPQLDEITSRYGIEFDPRALEKYPETAPVQDRIGILLDTLESEGVTLTPKGNLPTHLVRAVVTHRPDQLTRPLIEMGSRYYEDNFFVAQQVHVLADVAQLIRISGRKVLPGRMFGAYRAASPAQQYLYLLDQYEKINLGYFDSHQEESITHEVKLLLARLLRNRDPAWHSSREYIDWLVEAYTGVSEWIEEAMHPESLFSKDPYEQFARILETRVLARYMVPFGLVEEQEGEAFPRRLQTRKTGLLDALMRPEAPRDSSGILTRKVLAQFAARAEKFRFDDPFHVLAYGLSTCIDPDPCDPESLADVIASESKTPQVLKTEERRFYTELFDALKATIRYFLTPESGDKKEQEEGDRNLRSFLSGLYLLLPREKPYLLFQQLTSAAWATDLTLRKYFDIAIEEASADERIEQRLSEDVRMHLMHFFALLEEIEKTARKAKRINKRFKETVEEALQSFVLFHLTVMLDRKNRESDPEETAGESLPRVYQLRIDLMETKPPIWRRILIPETATLHELHCAIQGAMGWTNSHLHDFEYGDMTFGPAEDDFRFMEIHDETRYTIGQLLQEPKDYLYYEYDFGDGWRHRVRLEKILDPMPDVPLPRCIKARGACPPEDIGGVWGYYNMLEKLADPDDPERDEYLEWLGGAFDPNDYDIEEANAIMAGGCPDWM